MKNKKNFLLISLDCVRADVGYSGKFPNIEKLRKQGVSFMNTISSAPITPISHATVLTGLQPYNHGIRHLFKEKLNKSSITLQEVFKKNGYKTAAIVSCPGMNKWYGFGKGFELYDDEIPRLPDGTDALKTIDVKLRGCALKRANIVTEKAINWLRKLKKDENFFLFVHYFDAHWPYEAPEKYGGKNCYEEEVAFSDHYLGILLNEIKNLNLDKETNIVCFSDHGEDLGGLYPNDHAGKKLGHPEEEGHGCLLYDSTLKVLLIVNGEKIPKNQRIDSQVRLVDLFPTVLDMFKLKTKKNVDGTSLLPIVHREKIKELPAYSETFYPDELAKKDKTFKNISSKNSIRILNKHKIIFNVKNSKLEVYDLEKDKDEKRPFVSG